MTADVDVLIVGGGPAGAVTAAALSPRRSVLLVDRSTEDVGHEGETLAPAAGRVLRDAGLSTVLEGAFHRSISLRRSTWGGRDEVDAIRDPEGPHHLIDRQQFDRALREAAIDRGAVVRRGWRLAQPHRLGDGWIIELVNETTNQEIRVGARVVVDATGRRRSVARRLGARSHHVGQLVSRSVIGSQRSAVPGITDVAADADGWWFTTALSGGRRLLSWQTDVDLLGARCDADLVDAARRNEAICEVLGGFEPVDRWATRTASMSRLDRVVGESWVAVGDAALGLDPLSSQGLFAGLYSGFTGAATIDGALAGDSSAWTDYERSIESVWATNLRLLHIVYSAERRWSDRPFWTRRAGLPVATE